MLDILPKRAFLRFELPILRRAAFPVVDANIDKWEPRYLLPPLVELEGQRPIADVYLAWNEDGLLAAFDVPGRRGPLRCRLDEWWKGDGVRLCIDTRDTRDNRRATQYCHFFYALPTSPSGRPVVGVHRMSQAREFSPPGDVRRIRIASRIAHDRYSLELFIPADCLHGWDPLEHPRIGLFYKVKDTTLGQQHLTVTDELGWNIDPSTWATGVLARE